VRIWRGKTIAEKAKEKTNQRKKPDGNKPLTAAQRRKVKELREKLDEQNRRTISAMTKGAVMPDSSEIR